MPWRYIEYIDRDQSIRTSAIDLTKAASLWIFLKGGRVCASPHLFCAPQHMDYATGQFLSPLIYFAWCLTSTKSFFFLEFDTLALFLQKLKYSKEKSAALIDGY